MEKPAICDTMTRARVAFTGTGRHGEPCLLHFELSGADGAAVRNWATSTSPVTPVADTALSQWEGIEIRATGRSVSVAVLDGEEHPLI